jgi:hypothetical protein
MDKWQVTDDVWLDDAEAYHRKSPDTFEIPPKDLRYALPEGDGVKLIFQFPDTVMYGGVETSSERMWVEVTGVTSRDGEPEVPTYTGVLRSTPFHEDSSLKLGATVRFQPHHVCGHVEPPEPVYCEEQDG